ncbi:MAG TPA: hypothetical protein ENI99_00440 [Sedimenticola sp.]|nr:hypothetical protein [Sedimenticola sp.]
MPADYLLLAGCWLIYFIIHSMLASLGLKRWVAARWPGFMPAYRLAFNALAVILIIPPLILMYALHGPWLWQWTGAAAWLANGLAVLALLGFFWSLRYYDGMEFLGVRQWRAGIKTVEDQEQFRISPLHRFVRHPWYSLALVLIWTRDMDAAFLVTAVVATFYFTIGSRMEERKLLQYHGEIYRRYREQVPGLIPLPWRYLDREAARRLEQEANSVKAIT